MTYGNLHTTVSWRETVADLKECFRKWGVEDYILPTKQESERIGCVEVSFAKRGVWAVPRCARFSTPEQNIRAVYLALDAVRLADQRGIGELMAEASRVLALPDPSQAEAVIARFSAAISADEVRAKPRMYYAQALHETHPDHGGRREDFDAVRRAGEQMGVA
jgi:hypothetical protein